MEKYDTLGAVREKSAKRIAADQQDLLELPNICFMGTNVVSGTATAVVVATGARTYFGSAGPFHRRFASADRLRPWGEQRQLAADPLHAGDGCRSCC
ncbi:magnesium-transporting ATPase [Pseudomonas aeruginosa]|nr:magnesium-transporting ATPase [Pseudomonas aeruginosa]